MTKQEQKVCRVGAKMLKKELQTIIEKHKKWLNEEQGGERADLREVDLIGADLREADLSGADLSEADLSGADLSGAALRKAELRLANLRKADLSWADLREVDLIGADLSEADLSGAALSGAALSKIRYDEKTAFYAMACPEKGSFIGFKKAGGKIVELMITEKAKRSSATTRKCRCSEAVVLSITNIDGTNFDGKKVASDYDKSFVYEVGKTISVNNFNENRWEECSEGIHFFLTRDEAVRY